MAKGELILSEKRVRFLMSIPLVRPFKDNFTKFAVYLICK